MITQTFPAGVAIYLRTTANDGALHFSRFQEPTKVEITSDHWVYAWDDKTNNILFGMWPVSAVAAILPLSSEPSSDKSPR